MKKLVSLFTLLALLCTLTPLPVHADIQDARDRSYLIALSSKRRGFNVSPTGISGHLFAGEYYNVRVTVKKGVDYAILVGGDINARDIDLYVFDEEGNVWMHDTRPQKDAAVEKTASYSGYLDVYIHMRKASGLASFSVLAGRRI
jgi:hypothetical protein